MIWMLWVVIGFLAVSMFATISAVGEPRPPVTAGSAATTTGVVLLLVALIVFGGMLR